MCARRRALCLQTQERFYRDGPLQTNPDGTPNANGQVMVGTYYLHQYTISEIISDSANQNVQAALTAPGARQMSGRRPGGRAELQEQSLAAATAAYRPDSWF